MHSDIRSFSFVVKSTADCTNYLRYPDCKICWSDVVLVIARSTHKLMCPICLSEIFVVPRVSWCGHILCYPCMISYFDSGDSQLKSCPICQEVIYFQEMKPISISNYPPSVKNPTPDCPQSITMCLVKKTKVGDSAGGFLI